MSEKTVNGRRVQSISLINGGLKGLRIVYEVSRNLDGNMHKEVLDHTIKVPVGEEVKIHFRELRHYMLDVIGFFAGEIDEDVQNDICMDSEVTKITLKEDAWLLTGNRTVLGNKVVALNTPLVKATDEYKHYEDADLVIEDLFEAVGKYMDNKVKIDKKQVVLDFYGEAKIDAMTDEEKKNAYTTFLEKTGSIVLHKDEVEDAS